MIVLIKLFSSAPSFTNYFNCKPGSNGVFSRNNLPRVKDRVYVINLDDKKK